MNKVVSLQNKPPIPKVVATYIEDCKEDGISLGVALITFIKPSILFRLPSDLSLWYVTTPNSDEIFARAWLDGYTIKSN